MEKKYEDSAHGAIITLAPLLGIFTASPFDETGPMGFTLAGTASSQESSCEERVEGSAEYQEPACEASRVVIVKVAGRVERVSE